LIRKLRSCWDRAAPRKEADVLSDLCKLDVLVLDEVGVQFGRDSEIVQLTEVLDLRYRDIKPTLLISNVPYRDLGQFVGERIVDRIRENGGKVLIFDWESRRGQAPAQPVTCLADATQRLQ
jgi:DNA replication protein DnaC